MLTMQKHTSENSLDEICGMVASWTSERLAKNLRVFVNRGDCTLEMPSFNPDQQWWDGTLLIHFTRELSAADVINYIVAFGRADEISMSGNTLRLWWD